MRQRRVPATLVLMMFTSILVRRLTLVSVPLSCAVLLTACGSSSKKATAAATTPSASAPATSGSTGATSKATSGGSGGSADMNACSLLTPAQVSAAVGFSLTTATPKTIASGQDQCDYSSSSSSGVTVIIYQPGSGVSFNILTDGTSATKSVSGVGDKAATDGTLEIDVQAGNRLIAVQSGSDNRIAVAKALVAALH